MAFAEAGRAGAWAGPGIFRSSGWRSCWWAARSSIVWPASGTRPHYTLFKSKHANDLVADLFCMIPILTCVHLYRVFHMAHHQYTNDPDQDPDLLNMGRSTRVGEFPMPRTRFVVVHFLRWLTDPWSMIRYQGDYLYVNTLGKGRNAYMERVSSDEILDAALQIGTSLGLVTLGLFAASCGCLTGTATDRSSFPLPSLSWPSRGGRSRSCPSIGCFGRRSDRPMGAVARAFCGWLITWRRSRSSPGWAF